MPTVPSFVRTMINKHHRSFHALPINGIRGMGSDDRPVPGYYTISKTQSRPILLPDAKSDKEAVQLATAYGERPGVFRFDPEGVDRPIDEWVQRWLESYLLAIQRKDGVFAFYMLPVDGKHTVMLWDLDEFDEMKEGGRAVFLDTPEGFIFRIPFDERFRANEMWNQ